MPNNDNINQFLDLIRQIESSGGQNFAHKPITSGIHEGTSAIGSYGLMPNTIKELINRRIQQHAMNKQFQQLQSMNPDQLKTYLESQPNTIERNIASDLAQKVLSRSGDDIEKAAYMWNMGHNLSPESITPEKLEQSPYVQKFRNLRGLLPQVESPEIEAAKQRALERSLQYRSTPIPVGEDNEESNS